MTATIDMTALSARHSGTASASRARRRHWAEVRLKAYGLIAIGLAALALGILIYTVVVKTVDVFYEYKLSLDMTVTVSDRDRGPLTDGNPSTSIDLKAPIRTALKEQVSAELGGRKAFPLYDLISSYEGFELAKIVEADPALIGEKYRFTALLDDQAQMYLKGGFGELVDAGTAGDAGVSRADNGTVVISVNTSALAEARTALRETRAAEARLARAEARRQAHAVEVTTAALATAEGETRGQLQTQLEQFEAARDAANAKANALLREATEQTSAFTLGESDPSILVQINGGWVKLTELARERLTGIEIEPLETLDTAPAGLWRAELMAWPEGDRTLKDNQIVWLEDFQRRGKIEAVLNTRLLTASDSQQAELAGIWGALVGSFWTMIVTFALAFPVGVMASIYLEEFAPKNRLTDFIEVNINNLAAVPSIVFGLLGVTVLISGVQLFGIDLFGGLLKNIAEDPRSTPLAGGVVLALMSLPTIIIAGRASIRAVPPSIRDAALGIGASKLQTSTHHVLPLAMPGILTGSIIAMAQALGETAPLIIIGMNSFIQEAPGTPLDKGNVLPSLIYIWNNNSERLFDGKTAAAISVLLIFLIAMNALAVLLRKRFERRW